MSMVHCRGCGKEIHEAAYDCPSCGAPQNLKNGEGKSKVIAALLAFFIGAFGVHRFYLGQWRGLFYLFFCWTMIPSLISFIEGIVFLLSNQTNWDNKYNKGITSGQSSGIVILAVVIAGLFSIFLLIAIVGILAAVAIPSYQDYTTRAQVAEGVVVSHHYKTILKDHYAKTNDFSTFNNSDLEGVVNSKYVDSVTTDLASKEMIVIILTFKQTGVNSNIQGKEFRVFTDDGGVTWECGFNIEGSILMGENIIPYKYLPSICK